MSQSDDAVPEWVTTKVAARFLGIHEETLREWNRESLYQLPKPSRVGSRFRWDLTKLRAWVESKQITA
ncbi:helix-turn-helix transcriptional regulator [Mycobacteroides abscessus]|uniref:helix-turn-helix transcriptional regulator n=1 Tax=Mycobacteroides abscessus TaxID=36809 RepID=UPI002102AECF|nr:helix-turn-helix domain-containing protein [Mycobacteroides abscessus]